MIPSSACRQFPHADQPGQAGYAWRPSLSYTTQWGTIDRDRIEEALSLAVASRSYYDHTLSMMTRRGWRRIQTIGYWQPTPYGGCTHLAGWFVDVSDGLAPYDFNIDVAVHYIHLAQRAARAGGHNLANYLLEDVLIELEDVQKRSGPNIIRLTLDPDRDTA